MLGLGLLNNKNAYKKSLPLDTYKNNVVMGFSYYKLLSSYSGNCVRVRRSSDNTEQDFGFRSGYIDSTAILTFCNGGNGYVKTWYNQYSSGNNAVQATTANQPQIVSSGVFEANGIKFVQGASTKNLAFSTYAQIDIISPTLTTYVNNYVEAKHTGWMYQKADNNDGATVQHGVVYLIGGDYWYSMNGSTKISFAYTIGANKYLTKWTSKSSNGISMNNNGNTYSGTMATDLTNRNYVMIGGKIDNAGYPASEGWVGYKGNIKSIIITNNDADYSVMSKV